MGIDLSHYEDLTRAAVSFYWCTLSQQSTKQRSGIADVGRRSAVTGGRQMMGFCTLIRKILTANGLKETSVFVDRKLELPGFYRPAKKWDMLVVTNDILIAALEFKSQVGSFGNNLNNRSEEAIGTASDLWVAFREGAFGKSPRPWLGTLMLFEDCEASTTPVKVKEPHFKVFPEFRDASYTRRYELLLRKLVQERLYDSAVLLTATKETGPNGDYREPSRADLGMRQFLAGLVGHAIARQAGDPGQ